MKIFDSFMFYNELDLLEVRLEFLYPIVDYFVISECNETFSGINKEFLFEKNISRYSQFMDKIIYQKLETVPENFKNFNKQFYTNYNKSYSHKHNGKPLIELNKTFQKEVFQRDSLIEPLLKWAEDDDIILMSDLDEIPSIEAIIKAKKDLNDKSNLIHFEQKWFMYYFNNYSENKWYGTHACKMSFLKEFSIDLLQYHKENKELLAGNIISNGGWHFSFLGGSETIIEKLKAYDYQGGRSSKILAIIDKIFPSRIQNKLKQNKDIFIGNRNFIRIDLDTFFPEKLQILLNKYPQHLYHI